MNNETVDPLDVALSALRDKMAADENVEYLELRLHKEGADGYWRGRYERSRRSANIAWGVAWGLGMAWAAQIAWWAVAR